MAPVLATVASFNGSDGEYPQCSLIADANGDLFGTTPDGGANGNGTVFKIVNNGTPSAPSYASPPTTVVSFNGSDGGYPLGSLIADANGDLFGTTFLGGANSDGAVFEIAKTATGYASAPTILVSFNGSNGAYPHGSLIADANGDLFGTTYQGGANGDGAVFEIVNNGTLAAPSYASTPTTLASFYGGGNGYYPQGSLIADANGDLFGTTGTDGTYGYGTIFEIAQTASGYAGAPTILASFNSSDGQNPHGSLIADAIGDLFGTTYEGGANGYGTIFEIVNNGTPAAPNYASTPTTVVSFNGSNGAYPYGSLIADANGDLFATTYEGGTYGLGAVFEITNSGFAAGAPTIAITTPIADDNAVNKAEAAAGFAISGSETGADGQTVTVKIVNGSSQVIDMLTTTAASGAWSVNVTTAQAQALANGSYTVEADVSNVAGTPASEAAQTITVDETTPTVSVGVNSDDVNLANDTATVTFSFSAAPAAFSLSDATAVGGTLSNLQQVNPAQYTATFTAASNTDMSNAVVGVTANSYQDGYGNPGAAGASSDFVVDTVTPTVSVGVSSTDVNIAHNTATVTSAFSEAPIAFSFSDVTAVGGTLSALTEVNATTYTATFTGALNTDINDAAVSVTAGSWQEVNGNSGAAGASSDFVVDTVTPTVSVDLSRKDLTLAHDTATATFTFSEAPTAFSLSDVTALGGTLSALTEVNPTTYTATFTGAVNTDIDSAVVSVTAGSWEEINGNPGAAGSSAAFTVNTMDHWIKSASANWSTAADWGNAVPSASVGADVDASGTYKVSISNAVAAYGLTVNDAGATVTDNAGGTLTLDGTGGSSSPNGVLDINAGIFVLNGGALRAGLVSIANGGELLVSLGAYPRSSGASKAIVDDGSITFSDGSPVTVSRSISGSGSVNVDEGSVTFTRPVTGSEIVTVENTADAVFDTPIAGTGTFVVRNSGALEFGAADSENVRFAAGSTATLKLDHSLTAPFTGTIAGLTKNDSVDLADLTWVKGDMHATFSGDTSGGVLTVSDGSNSVELDLSGNYTTSTWALSSDGSGGTAVTDPPAHNSDDYDLLVGPVSGTGEFNLSGRLPPESGAGVSSGQTLTFGAGATDELIGSAYSFDGMVDDIFTSGDAVIASTFAESARALLYPQTGADGARTLTDGANSAVLNLSGEPYALSDFSIMSEHNGAGLAIKSV